MRHFVTLVVTLICCLPVNSLLSQEVDVQTLAEQLADENVQTALDALKKLTEMGAEAAPGVPALIEVLKSSEPRARVYAAHALEAIGEPAAPAVETLSEAIFDEEPRVRRAAFEALVATNVEQEVIQPFVERILAEGNPHVILPALQMIAEHAREGVPSLRALLKKEEIAYWGTVLAADLGPKAAAAVPELTELLDHAEPEVKLQTALALGAIGPEAAAAVPGLVKILNEETIDGVRFAAAYALGEIGKQTDPVNHALVDAAREDQPILKIISLWSLARLNPDQSRVVQYAAETIVAGLTSEDPQVRSAAARALTHFTGHPDIVGPALVEALDDAEPEIVGNALDALAAFGPKILDNVGKALKNEKMRHHATRLLFRMGTEAAPAVPELIESMENCGEGDDANTFCIECQLTLAAIGPAAAAAIPALINSLASDEGEVRGTACYALGKIGPEAAAAVDPLKQRAGELDGLMKLPMFWAILRISPGEQEIAAEAAPLLTQALDNADPTIRAEVAEMLGQLGELALPALDRLKLRLLDEDDQTVREAIKRALDRLQANSGNGATP